MKLRKNLFRLFSGRFCAALVIFSLIFSTTASGVSAARHGMGRGELPRHALRAQQEQESFGPKQLRPALQKASAGRSRSGLEEIGVIPDAHKGPVVSVAFNPVDRAPDLLATAAPDGFRLWSARGTQPSRHPLKDSADGFLVGQPGIKVVQFSTNGRDLLSVGPTKTLRYEVAHGRKMGSPLEHKDPLVPSQFQEQMLIALSPGRTAAAVGHTGGSGVVVWNLAKGRMKKPGGQIRGPMKSLFFPQEGFYLTSVAYRPEPLSMPFNERDPYYLERDGSVLATGTKGGDIQLWNVSGSSDWLDKPFIQLPSKDKNFFISALLFAPYDSQNNKDFLAAGDSSGAIRLLNTRTGQTVWEKHHEGKDEICALAFTPDGKIVASAGRQGRIYFWDVRNGELKGVVEGPQVPIRSLAFHREGTKFVAGREDGSLLFGSMPLSPKVEPSVISVSSGLEEQNLEEIAKRLKEEKVLASVIKEDWKRIDGLKISHVTEIGFDAAGIGRDLKDGKEADGFSYNKKVHFPFVETRFLGTSEDANAYESSYHRETMRIPPGQQPGKNGTPLAGLEESGFKVESNEFKALVAISKFHQAYLVRAKNFAEKEESVKAGNREEANRLVREGRLTIQKISPLALSDVDVGGAEGYRRIHQMVAVSISEQELTDLSSVLAVPQEVRNRIFLWKKAVRLAHTWSVLSQSPHWNYYLALLEDVGQFMTEQSRLTAWQKKYGQTKPADFRLNEKVEKPPTPTLDPNITHRKILAALGFLVQYSYQKSDILEGGIKNVFDAAQRMKLQISDVLKGRASLQGNAEESFNAQWSENAPLVKSLKRLELLLDLPTAFQNSLNSKPSFSLRDFGMSIENQKPPMPVVIMTEWGILESPVHGNSVVTVPMTSEGDFTLDGTRVHHFGSYVYYSRPDASNPGRRMTSLGVFEIPLRNTSEILKLHRQIVNQVPEDGSKDSRGLFDEIQKIVPVPHSATSPAGLEEAAKQFVDGVEQIPGSTRRDSVGFYLEGKGALFAPLMASLEVHHAEWGNSFAGVVQTLTEKSRLLDVIHDLEVENRIGDRIFVVEEQGELLSDRARYEQARWKAMNILDKKGKPVVMITRQEPDLLAQLNRLLDWAGYRLKESDDAAQQAARLLLDTALTLLQEV